MSNVNFDYKIENETPGHTTAQFTCHQCRASTRIELKGEYLDPVYVMGIAEENVHLRLHLSSLNREFSELAHECLDAGVKPAVMRRFEEVMALIKKLYRKF